MTSVTQKKLDKNDVYNWSQLFQINVFTQVQKLSKNSTGLPTVRMGVWEFVLNGNAFLAAPLRQNSPQKVLSSKDALK